MASDQWTVSSAESLIIQPHVEASAERLDGGFLLRWRLLADTVTVYIGDDPARIERDRPLAVLPGRAGEGRVSDPLPGSRPYFELCFNGGPDDGRRVITAERVLPLSGGVNFRDLGGYATSDGRRTRWGRLYRSGSLADLTEEDIAYLGRLGLRLVCDLRSVDEVERKADRLPPGAEPFHRPIVASVNPLRRMVTLYRKRNRMQELLQDVYTVMIDQNGGVFGDLFQAAADPACLPLVVHCTAGKDRTGIAVALLLLALGVPEETVVADYTLSNRAFDVLEGRMRPEMERLYSLGFGDAQVRPFLLAEARTLQGALAHIRQRYASVEAYLARAGVAAETIAAVRENLLQ